MGRKSTVSNGFSDPTRADFGLRLSAGAKFQLRASPRLRELFPDGCKLESRKTGDAYEISIVNRASGYKMSLALRDTPKAYAALILDKAKVTGDALPEFGAVSPEKVVQVRGGLVIMLPAELPVLSENMSRPKGSRKKEKVPATPAPAVEKPAQQQAPRDQTPAAAVTKPAPSPQPDARVALPNISLREAVQAVNAYKRAMPDKVELTLTEQGTIRALAEYE